MSFLASDAFQKLWVELNRRAHKQLVKVLTGKGGKLVQTKNGQVVVNLAPALARVEQRLHDRGIDIFDRIPPSAIPSNFVILDSKQLKQGQRGVRLLKTLAIALPLLVLVLLAAAIALSRAPAADAAAGVARDRGLDGGARSAAHRSAARSTSTRSSVRTCRATPPRRSTTFSSTTSASVCGSWPASRWSSRRSPT